MGNNRVADMMDSKAIGRIKEAVAIEVEGLIKGVLIVADVSVTV